MKKFTLSSPAKINLFLHIVGRRPDGYHNLQSVFAILNKGDKLTFEERMDDKIEILPDLGFNVEDNIVYKAIMLLRKETSISKGITITIEKNIPMGGGLGGGSSNAATTLLALNKLWNLNLTTKRLCELGKTLGADVPIFVNGYSAFAQGIGEILTPYKIEEKYYLVVTPKNTHVSTKEIFTHLDLPRSTPALAISQISYEETHNDCENLVKKNYPSVAKCLQWLLKYAHPRMTGTGASCFAPFDNLSDAQKAQNELPEQYSSFIAKATNKSILLDELDKI
ncbi:MAG: 4-(cytidine 5'-diphospho)-2-C-methyl-D-erythritol kinase [Succinivibrionaceae bacterium]|nr:4-(cytidine 5'-diphospho)-2-C-methyl-D-erythritol kinase [Ruminobacter sp.]MDY5779867.1 4-(cytidine 5'-diphospho)-2-C-methyl-D-erythritol kinase [Succinivibrionaceae bacterium]MEE1340269.1 4-(cytidine 5'-diphospho)-2-C-methyl-D-erythritol kinase [Succinivibrionaceae bacterium]